MKTSRANIYNMKNEWLVIFIVTVIFFLTSCRKEDQVKPSEGANALSEKQMQMEPVDPNANDAIDMTYSQTDPPLQPSHMMVKIDHRAGGSLFPDYCVSVFSDGKVIFEGRRNVAVARTVVMQVQDDKLAEIKSYFELVNFYSLIYELPEIADSPVVLTSYCPEEGMRIKVLKDYNTGEPFRLFFLRNKVESILNILPLISGLQSETASDIMVK